jgi:hypothetical protein
MGPDFEGNFRSLYMALQSREGHNDALFEGVPLAILRPFAHGLNVSMDKRGKQTQESSIKGQEAQRHGNMSNTLRLTVQNLVACAARPQRRPLTAVRREVLW